VYNVHDIHGSCNYYLTSSIGCNPISLSACISQKPHNLTSQNVLHMLTEVMARSSSHNAICYELKVLRTTSCFHIMCHMACERLACNVTDGFLSGRGVA